LFDIHFVPEINFKDILGTLGHFSSI